MRDLVFSDVFTVIRIIKKAGISKQVRSIFAEMEGKTVTDKELGAKFIFSIIENLDAAQEEITEFLASIKGIDKKEMEKLSLDETIEFFMELANHPKMKHFLSNVSKLMR